MVIDEGTLISRKVCLDRAINPKGVHFGKYTRIIVILIVSTLLSLPVTATEYGKEINRDIELQGGDLYNNGNVKRITNSREEYLKYLNTPVFFNALEIKALNNVVPVFHL